MILENYNKAIQFLHSHFASGSRQSFRVIIIVSMLFISLELLRGQLNAAMTHWRCGLKLLHSLQGNTGLVFRDTLIVLPAIATIPQTLDEHLAGAFANIDAQSIFCSIAAAKPNTMVQSPVPPQQLGSCWNFGSIPEATQYLCQIMSSVLYHLQRANKPLVLDPETQKIRDNLQYLLERWLSGFHNSLKKFDNGPEYEKEFSIPILQIYHTMLTIMIKSCRETPSEMIFDEFKSDFMTILKDAEPLTLHFNLTEAKSSCLSSPTNLGLLAPLFYTLKKCRIPSVRRKAIIIIDAIQDKEGVWETLKPVTIAKRIAELEHDDFKSASDEQLPPECSRFSDIRVLLPQKPNDPWTLLCTRPQYGVVGGDWVSEKWDFP
ncbi:hypothetical protein F5884DRAFT_468092 [Xylogone sp. PMI_703]|nr:hypothetical protein F5884DRAFT_468092 [Xylogone sp. PMI_703]